MTFALGPVSKRKLVGVHLDLVSVIERAIEHTGQDFSVIEGVRTSDRQRQLVEAGANKTLSARYITGHAVSIGACVGGTIVFDWQMYFKIAEAMKQASRELLIPMRWGGVLDRVLGEMGDLDDEVCDYVLRQKAAEKRAFLDVQHFELLKAIYP